MSLARRCIFAIAVLTAFSASFAKEAIQLFESGHAPSQTRAWWVDDSRVLFSGVERPNPVDMKEVRYALLIWDLGKQPTTYKKGVDALICYRNNRLIYIHGDREAKTRTAYFGQMGREAPVTGNQYWDTLNCEPREAIQPKANERVTRPLLHDHGYLDLGLRSETAKDPAIFIRRRDSSDPVRLPFSARQFVAPRFDYYPFRGAYFFWISRARKPGEESLSSPIEDIGYWVWPEGEFERVDLPREIAGMYPTRAGFVYRIFGTRSDDGLYLMKSGKERKRLIKGSITQLSVSPSGCKVAFQYAVTHEAALWRPNKPTSRTLRVATLCN
jgi:hypothetical protein